MFLHLMIGICAWKLERDGNVQVRGHGITSRRVSSEPEANEQVLCGATGIFPACHSTGNKVRAELRKKCCIGQDHFIFNICTINVYWIAEKSKHMNNNDKDYP